MKITEQTSNLLRYDDIPVGAIFVTSNGDYYLKLGSDSMSGSARLSNGLYFMREEFNCEEKMFRIVEAELIVKN